MSFDENEKSIENIISLKSEQTQAELAEQAQQQFFTNEEDVQKTAIIIDDFVNDYLDNGQNQPINDWLLNRFNCYPEIWESEDEKTMIANTIIETIDSVVAHQLSVEKHLQKGKTLTNYLAKQIDTVAAQQQVDPEVLWDEIDQGITKGNQAYSQLMSGNATTFTPTEQNTNKHETLSQKITLNNQCNLALYGIKTIGTRLYNAIKGKENPTRAEQITHILRSSIDSTQSKGMQVAMSGGIIVSAKKGYLRHILDISETLESAVGKARALVDKVQNITLNVAEGWNDIRILDRLEQGAILAIDVAKEKAKFTVAKIATAVEQKSDLICKNVGRKVGTAMGTFFGGLFNPAAAATAGQVCGYLGEKAGELFSKEIVKPVVKKAREVADKAIDYVADTAKSFVSTVKETARKALNWCKSLFS